MKNYNFQLTLNNSTQEEREKTLKDLSTQASQGAIIFYAFGGTEKAPTTGMEHNHIYVCYKEEQTLRTIKRGFQNKTLHIEEARGTKEDNLRYASKENDFIAVYEDKTTEIRQNTFETKKTSDSEDYTGFIKDCKTGTYTLEDLIEKYPSLWIKYNRSFQLTFNRYNERELDGKYKQAYERLKNIIYYGTNSKEDIRKQIENIDESIQGSVMI